MHRPGIGAVLVTLLLSGCSAASDKPLPVMRWTKGGASYNDYLGVRYRCAQEASRQVSVGSYGTYGGEHQSRPVVSMGLFQACMGAAGWRQSATGYAPPPGEAIQMVD